VFGCHEKPCGFCIVALSFHLTTCVIYASYNWWMEHNIAAMIFITSLNAFVLLFRSKVGGNHLKYS
jgi:hypothetical protein